MFNCKFLKTYIPLKSRENMRNIEKNMKKKSGSEKKFWLRYRYQNWTLVSVPDTETENMSHTTL